jgi:hypothetical protein
MTKKTTNDGKASAKPEIPAEVNKPGVGLARVNLPTVREVANRFADFEPPQFDNNDVAEICGLPASRLDDLSSKPQVIVRGECLFLMSDPVVGVARTTGRWALMTPEASEKAYAIDPNRQGLVINELGIPDIQRVFRAEAEARQYLESCEEASVSASESVEQRARLLVASGVRRVMVGLGLFSYLENTKPCQIAEGFDGVAEL